MVLESSILTENTSWPMGRRINALCLFDQNLGSSYLRERASLLEWSCYVMYIAFIINFNTIWMCHYYSSIMLMFSIWDMHIHAQIIAYERAHTSLCVVNMSTRVWTYTFLCMSVYICMCLCVYACFHSDVRFPTNNVMQREWWKWMPLLDITTF